MDSKFDELLKTERLFLEEMEAVKNENGKYLYKSTNEDEILLLDFYLKHYKDWLVQNGMVKLLT
jgi:hypothetical protein